MKFSTYLSKLIYKILHPVNGDIPQVFTITSINLTMILNYLNIMTWIISITDVISKQVTNIQTIIMNINVNRTTFSFNRVVRTFQNYIPGFPGETRQVYNGPRTSNLFQQINDFWTKSKNNCGTEFWEETKFWGKNFEKINVWFFFWKMKIWKKILEKKFSKFFFNFKYYT